MHCYYVHDVLYFNSEIQELRTFIMGGGDGGGGGRGDKYMYIVSVYFVKFT